MNRAIDFTLSLVATVLLMPLILFVALAVLLAIGKPVLFFQERIGLNGAPFKMVKFRTMLEAVDACEVSLRDDLRLTRFGKFLRQVSLDELPELWNVLKGDMSLVGPRPLLVEYLPLYSTEQARRHTLRPGITGWAQVNGRNAISWEEKFMLDIWYVDNKSLRLDLKILFMTVGKFFMRSNINAIGHATMPKFTGRGSQDQN
jgi:lipopolysaccharide/colanic/teichoic acid biosynthesis glycosyltransferase